MPKKKTLDTAPYKGVRDFYPKDQALENYMFRVWREVVRSFGYEEYNASPLEPSELYEAKSGEEIVNEQTYKFKDRGKRSVTLRPEMTPTVARMVAARERELPFPLRWYSIPNVFRYEKPQKGRLREHYQLNVDLFGSDSIESEVEIISVASRILKEFGAKESDFLIRVNNRKIMEALYENLKITKTQAKKLAKVIDKKEKISKDAFSDAVEEIVKKKKGKLLENLESNQKLIETLGEDHPEVAKLIDLIESLDSIDIKNVEFTPTLMRGFDYYTGMVFEIFDTHKDNNRSLFGGGRYDELMEIFGKRKIPTIGFGMGDVTLKDFLETHNLVPKLESVAKLYICVEEDREYARILAESLRDAGVNTCIDLSGKPRGEQFKLADKKGIPFAAYKEGNQVVIRNLKTREDTKLAESKVAQFIFDSLYA